MGKKYFVVGAKCSSTGKSMGIQFEDCGSEYYAVGCISSGNGTGGSSETHTGKFLNRAFKCRHCGNEAFIRCSCGVFSCVAPNAPKFTCPVCGETFTITWTTAENIEASSADSKNQ